MQEGVLDPCSRGGGTVGVEEVVFQSGESVRTGFLTHVLAAVMMVLLMTPHSEARTKRSQSAKVASKHQNPCPAAGSTNRPCKG